MIKSLELVTFLSLFFCYISDNRNIILLLGLFFLFFFIRKLYIDKFALSKDNLLIIIFAFLYPIRAISDYSLTISSLDIVEWKTYIILITLSLLSAEKENNIKSFDPKLNSRIGNALALSVFVFNIH